MVPALHPSPAVGDTHDNNLFSNFHRLALRWVIGGGGNVDTMTNLTLSDIASMHEELKALRREVNELKAQMNERTQPEPASDWLTLQEAAELLGYKDVSSVHRICKSGGLKKYRNGNSVRLRRDEVEGYFSTMHA